MNGRSRGVLVTGATGFVGRNLVARALVGGQSVLAAVRNPEKLRAQLAFENIPTEKLTILPAEPADWPAIEPERAVLGAGVLFGRSRAEYFATNVDWTLRVLRALPVACRTVVLSSQSAGGPTPRGAEARTESDPDEPITWYGESKLALEHAMRSEFPGRLIVVLRPPMILGPRDTATLPLFRMARGIVRIKPGLRARRYSFLAVDDLVAAIDRAFEAAPGMFYVAHPKSFSDRELIAAAAAACAGKGIDLPVPGVVVKAISAVVDAVPALRTKVPSLTRDRVRELPPLRWVVDGSRFAAETGWTAQTGLHTALRAAHDFYVREGSLSGVAARS